MPHFSRVLCARSGDLDFCENQAGKRRSFGPLLARNEKFIPGNHAVASALLRAEHSFIRDTE